MNDVVDFSRQGLRSKRFLKQLEARIENAVVSDIVVGVTGDVENFHLRPNGGKFRGQLPLLHQARRVPWILQNEFDRGFPSLRLAVLRQKNGA